MSSATSHWVRFTEPLTSADAGRPEPYVLQWLEQQTARLGCKRSEVKVIDVGCGRGDRVAWLLDQGWDAYGCDVEYVDEGSAWLEERGHGPNRLRVIEDYRLPFETEAPFDVVLSYQVMEHIPHFDKFVAGITDVGRPGTTGLHVCPGAWMPIETHMQLPFVHWLPKGRARGLAIKLGLRAGLGRPHFADRPVAERARRFEQFSRTEVFYRSPRLQSAAFQWGGHDTAFARVVGEKLQTNVSMPATLATALGSAYGRLRGCYLETVQRDDDPTDGRTPPSPRTPRR